MLVRVITEDDPVQSAIAERMLGSAALVAMPVPVLTEFCWVLASVYKYSSAEIASAVRTLTEADNVVTDLPAIEAGLALLEAGGDFADGVIAHVGRWMGAETLMSFDKTAVKLLVAAGHKAIVPT
jgi:predicted nucleic-acid-binding protein